MFIAILVSGCWWNFGIPSWIFSNTPKWAPMGRLLTLVRGHYQSLLFHNMNMMKKRWKSYVPVRWEPHFPSQQQRGGSRLSWGGFSDPFSAGSSKNLIFAVWMDHNGFGKKPFGWLVFSEFDGVLLKMLFISPNNRTGLRYWSNMLTT